MSDPEQAMWTEAALRAEMEDTVAAMSADFRDLLSRYHATCIELSNHKTRAAILDVQALALHRLGRETTIRLRELEGTLTHE